jgi:hypothetical protein
LKVTSDRDSILETYLCYRALLLAIDGKGDEADALRLIVRNNDRPKPAGDLASAG